MSKEKKRILAVVPARGGSKGIKLKNLKKINGKSLIQIVSEVILKSKIFTNAVVSTDNNLIRKEALKFGLDVPFIRPKSLSGDFISDVEVLRHALKKSESFYKVQYDYIMMLQPTSPLRTKKDLLKLASMMNKKKYDAIWTISETDLKFHPLKQLKIKDDFLNFWDSKGKNIIARQQLNSVYHRNGVGYIISRECLVKKNSIKGSKTGFLLIKTPQISIDTTEDLKKAISDAKSGQAEIRNDKDGNIGVSIGKKSFKDELLIKNYNAILDTLEKEKANNTLKGDLIKSSFITSTMGVSYKLKIGKNI